MANSKTSKLKRKPAPPIQLTDRDRDIIMALHKYRFLTTDHLQTLTDTKSRWGMNARLRLLYDLKYIDRPKAQFAIFSHADKRPIVYALGNKGASLLSSRYGISMPPKVYWTEKNRRTREKHIEHTLGIADFMVGIEMMCRNKKVLEILDADAILAGSPIQTRKAHYPFRWKTQISHIDKLCDIAIVPDCIFGLRHSGTGQEKFYFVEIDRGTMPVNRKDMNQTSFLRKIHSYIDTFERGLAKKRFNMEGFQVLTVTTSEKRIKKMQSAIGRLGKNNFSANTFLFKTKQDAQASFPFHSGWQNWKDAPADLF